jgi:hypothetical protein
VNLHDPRKVPAITLQFERTGVHTRPPQSAEQLLGLIGGQEQIRRAGDQQDLRPNPLKRIFQRPESDAGAVQGLRRGRVPGMPP